MMPPTPLPPIPPDSPGAAADPAAILGGDTANDVNLQLMSKDWGMNPPVREVVPARHPRYEANPMKTIGQGRASLPRERGGTAVAARLPPPMLPATAGHGLAPPYGGAAAGLSGLGGADAEILLPSPPKPSAPEETMRTANPALLQQVLGL